MKKTYLLIDGGYEPSERVMTLLARLQKNSQSIQALLVVPHDRDLNAVKAMWIPVIGSYVALPVIEKLRSPVRSMDLFMAVEAGKQRRDNPNVHIVILSPNTDLLPLKNLVDASIVFAKHWFTGKSPSLVSVV